MAGIEAALRGGYGVGLSLRGELRYQYGGTTTTLSHGVTCFGVRYDPTKGADDPARCTGIYIADSDSDKTYDDPASAPDKLRLVDCSYDAGQNRWLLDNYVQIIHDSKYDTRGSYAYIGGYTLLNTWPGVAAIAAAGVPDAEDAAVTA